jgi:uncharacterized membrane protein
MDSRARSLLKTVTWRVTGSSSTFLIAWIITGSLWTSSTIMLVQMVANTLLYYLHERLWQR